MQASQPKLVACQVVFIPPNKPPRPQSYILLFGNDGTHVTTMLALLQLEGQLAEMEQRCSELAEECANRQEEADRLQSQVRDSQSDVAVLRASLESTSLHVKKYEEYRCVC